MRGFELALFASVSRNRQAGEYKAYFPDGLTAIVAAPLTDEVNAVRRIEGQLAESTSELKKHLAPMTAGREALQKAMGALETADNAHAIAMTHELTARRDWIRCTRVIYGEILSQLPENRRRVEAYFRPRPEGVRAGAEETQPTNPTRE